MSPGAAELRRHDNGHAVCCQGIHGRRGAHGVGVPTDMTPDAKDARLVLTRVGVATWLDCPEDATLKGPNMARGGVNSLFKNLQIN